MIKLPPRLIYGILAYLSDSTHAVYYINTSAMQLTAFILQEKVLIVMGGNSGFTLCIIPLRYSESTLKVL